MRPRGPLGPEGPQGPVSADYLQPYEFVGFSDSPVVGGEGLIAIQNACKSKFGPSARLARSSEILESANLVTGIDGWVLAEVVSDPQVDISGKQ